MSLLESSLNFTKFMVALQKVERAIYIPGEDRKENDAEHSYQLAMLAWYLIQKQGLQLDMEKVFAFALVHDLVEVYAGDTHAHGDQARIDSKEAREREAAEKIAEQFPDFPEMSQTIAEYEANTTPEAQFVYVLDKIIPMLNIMLDGGRLWREQNITIPKIEIMKRAKVSISPELAPLFDEIMDFLASNPSYLP